MVNPIFRAILLCTLAALPSFSWAESVRLPEAFDVQAIDAFLQAQVNDYAGLSVAIVKDGVPLLVKGYGKASLADGQAVGTNTVFAIGSITKQFTVAAVFLLSEDGKLSVHDKVSKYYPKLARADEITLLDLMQHVSGYPDYYPLDFVDRRLQKPIRQDELLQEYAGGKLDFEPGSKWSYSNTGFILLGQIVEKVTGEDLGAFLTHRIFQRLGMEHTFYEANAGDKRIATGYASFALSKPEPVGWEASGWLGGAGGLYSTAGDLAKWDLALIGGKVLSPESFALMTTARILPNGRSTEYGCGLAVKIQNGRKVLSHNGAVSGFNAYNAVVPATRSALVILCNCEGGIRKFPSQILPLLLDEKSNVPQICGPKAIEAVKAVFAQFQRGNLERQLFDEEFNIYLTDEKVRGAAKRLKSYGKPKAANIVRMYERGGMECSTTQLTFSKGELTVQMCRLPNGKIAQFFVTRD